MARKARPEWELKAGDYVEDGDVVYVKTTKSIHGKLGWYVACEAVKLGRVEKLFNGLNQHNIAHACHGCIFDRPRVHRPGLQCINVRCFCDGRKDGKTIIFKPVTGELLGYEQAKCEYEKARFEKNKKQFIFDDRVDQEKPAHNSPAVG